MKSKDRNFRCGKVYETTKTPGHPLFRTSSFFRKIHFKLHFPQKCCAVVFLSLLLSSLIFQLPEFAAEAHVYRGEIFLGDTKVHNLSLKYPVVMINQLYYIPLNNEFLNNIGLEISDFPICFRDNYAVGNKIFLRKIKKTGEMTPEIFEESAHMNTVLPLIGTVYIDRNILRSNYPIYLLDHVPYLCLDDSNDFPADSIDILWRGIHTEDEKIPEYYNTFEYLPQSEFVRNQGSSQKCWAYAASSLFEIKIALNEGIFLNLSEDHLIEHCPVPTNAAKGGNWLFSSSYLTKLLGPVSEYDANSRLLGYHVREYSEAHGAEEIKRAIKKNGAVLTSIYYGPETAKFYDKTNFSYYHKEAKHKPTHELILVGWDDNYPKENFKLTPPGDGAFIAMNSFGTEFGKEGIFYISYHDDIATKTGISIDRYDANSRDFRVISKDKGGGTHYEALAAHHRNLYGIQKLSVEKKSKIRGVGVYSNGNAIVSAYYAEEMPTSESELVFLGDTYFENAGFKTIENDQNLQVEDSFYIILKYRSSKDFVIPIEAPYPGILYNVASEPGINFLAYSKNGLLIATPLEDIVNNGTVVLRLLIQQSSLSSELLP